MITCFKYTARLVNLHNCITTDTESSNNNKINRQYFLHSTPVQIFFSLKISMIVLFYITHLYIIFLYYDINLRWLRIIASVWNRYFELITGSSLINNIAEYTRHIFDQQALLSSCFNSRRAAFDSGCQTAGCSKNFRNIPLTVVILYRCTNVYICTYYWNATLWISLFRIPKFFDKRNSTFLSFLQCRYAYLIAKYNFVEIIIHSVVKDNYLEYV